MSRLKDFFKKARERFRKSPQEESTEIHEDLHEELYEDSLEDLAEEAEVPAKKGFFARFAKPKKSSSNSSAKPQASSGLIDKLFSPYSRPAIHRTFLLVGFISLFYFGARLLGVFLITPEKMLASPTPHSFANQNDTAESLRTVTTNDLFKAFGKVKKGKGPEKKEESNEPLICLESDKKSSLKLKLVSTMVLQDKMKSLASILVRGKNMSLREGDEVKNVAAIGRIETRRVVFKNLKNRRCEFIENREKDLAKKLKKSLPNIIRDKKKAKAILTKQQKKSISNEGNTYKIKKALRDELLSNISEILTQARALPIKNSDGTYHYKMQEIVPGSIYSQLNISDGDVITGINGNKFKSIAELMNLFSQIKDIDHFEISRKRNGVEETLEYDFE